MLTALGYSMGVSLLSVFWALKMCYVRLNRLMLTSDIMNKVDLHLAISYSATFAASARDCYHIPVCQYICQYM